MRLEERRTLRMLEHPTKWPLTVLPLKREGPKGPEVAVAVCVKYEPKERRYDVFDTDMFTLRLEEERRVMKGATPEEVVEEGWVVN